MGCFQQLLPPVASFTTVPPQFCVATFFTEIYYPFEMGFLFLQVILWYKHYCDRSWDKACSWCLRAHGLLDVHCKAEQSGLGCALVGYCWIPTAVGLYKNYSARKHLQKLSRPTQIHTLTAVLPTCSWNPPATGILRGPTTSFPVLFCPLRQVWVFFTFSKSPCSYFLLHLRHIHFCLFYHGKENIFPLCSSS